MENRGDMDHDQDDEGEGHEHLYPTSCGGYYVQSPSTISHANTTTSTYFINPDYSAFSISHIDTDHPNHNQCHQLFISTLNHDDHDDDDRDDDDDDQLISSHYLLRHVHGNHNKTKNNYDINEDHDRGRTSGEELVDRINNKDDYDDDDDDDDDDLYLNGKKRSAGWLSYNYSEDSIGWICIQMSWRCIFSICVALLVFYLVTKPPPPKVSVKVNGINEFLLGEGLDASGVSTKLLTFNCSINLFVLNKSKLFGLHVQTPVIQFSFGPLILFASSSSSSSPHELDNYINLLKWKIYVGTKNKPLYGAGRVMDDMLHSKKGLPLFFTLNFSSHSRVVWDLIRPTFHHHARCLLLLHPSYDKKHRTQSYNTTCTIS